MGKIVRRITEEDRKKFSQIIKDVVEAEKKDKNTKAVFVNCFRKDEIDNIYITVIRGELTGCSCVLWSSFNNDLVIRSEYVPQINYLQGNDPGLFKYLSEGTVLYDNADGRYIELQKDAVEYDFDCYDFAESTIVEFEPPLDIKKARILKK